MTTPLHPCRPWCGLRTAALVLLLLLAAKWRTSCSVPLTVRIGTPEADWSVSSSVKGGLAFGVEIHPDK